MADERIQRFIEYLCSLEKEKNRGALADLRRGLGKIPKMIPAEMYPYAVPFLTDKMKQWEQNNYFLVASLFGLHPEHSEDLRSMGSTFRMIAIKTRPAMDTARKKVERLPESVEHRFVHLLNSHREDLPHRLRHAVSLAKSKDVPIDYGRLLKDLRWWDEEHRRVQQRWAKDFWTPEASAKTEKSAVAQTTD